MRSKLEGEMNVLKEQIHSAEGNEEHLHSREDAIQASIQERQEEKEDILNQKAEIDEKLTALQQAREDARELLENVQNRIEELNNNIEN